MRPSPPLLPENTEQCRRAQVESSRPNTCGAAEVQKTRRMKKVWSPGGPAGRWRNNAGGKAKGGGVSLALPTNSTRLCSFCFAKAHGDALAHSFLVFISLLFIIPASSRSLVGRLRGLCSDISDRSELRSGPVKRVRLHPVPLCSK